MTEKSEIIPYEAPLDKVVRAANEIKPFWRLFFPRPYTYPSVLSKSYTKPPRSPYSHSSAIHSNRRMGQKLKTPKARKIISCFVAYIDNTSYLCTKKHTNGMSNRSFDILLLEDADKFLGTLSDKVRDKITTNMRKVASGIIDSTLFTKLDGSDDLWEFRTKYNGMEYRLLAFRIKPPIVLWWPLMAS